MELVEIAVLISILAIIAPLVFHYLSGKKIKKDKILSEATAKADKADLEKVIKSELKGKMKPLEERLSNVEESVRTIENSHDRKFDRMDSKFDLMMSEMKTQGDSMKRQADHIVKVFEEIKNISIKLENKQDRPS